MASLLGGEVTGYREERDGYLVRVRRNKRVEGRGDWEEEA